MTCRMAPPRSKTAASRPSWRARRSTGVGEAGTPGAIPAVTNAVNDALAQIGTASVEAPANYGEGLERAPVCSQRMSSA